jgi:ankyrin repeat protein
MIDSDKQLQEAVRSGARDQVRQLAAAGANVNAKDSEGNTPLCSTENGEIIQLLLSYGADPNLACDDGTTPLILAVMGQTPSSTIRVLLAAGANPNTPGIFGMTPLMHAAGNCDIEVVRTLISAGADVNAVDRRGKNALHAARKRPEIVALLQGVVR